MVTDENNGTDKNEDLFSASVNSSYWTVLIYAATPFFDNPIEISSLKKCPVDMKVSKYMKD